MDRKDIELWENQIRLNWLILIWATLVTIVLIIHIVVRW